jgi:hypothetical protein
MGIKVACAKKLLVYLARVKHSAVVHKTPFRLAGAPLTTQWLPSITFVKGEKNDEIYINKYATVYRSFATRVSQLKMWHF